MNTAPSLARIEISLEPREALPLPVRPTPWAIHAALHRLIERSAPTYAGRLHQAMPKPLSLTIGDARNSRVNVQLGLLTSETIEQVSSIIGHAVAIGDTIELDRVPYAITALRAHPVGDLPHALSYRELIERSVPDASLRMVFVTPATMRNDGESFASIEPRHVFGSGLVQRFRAFAGSDAKIDLDDATLGAIGLIDGAMYERRVSLARFQANAFTGWAVYTAPVEGNARNTLATLANFACFSGVGSRTAFGLGTVERRP